MDCNENDRNNMVGDFNIPLPVTGRSSRQKIRKDIDELNSTINQTVYN